MYRGVIQHLQYQSEYLKNQIRARGLVEPTGLGRIYRVVHETTTRGERPALSAKTPAQLVPVLAHPNGWWRDTAQRLLVERGDTSVAPALASLVASAPDPRTRLHALWTLDGLGALDAPVVQRALRDAAPEVRAAAIRVAEPWLAKPGDPLQAAVWQLATDRAPRVQWQLAISLAAFPADERVGHAARLLGTHGRDPFVVDGVVAAWPASSTKRWRSCWPVRVRPRTRSAPSPAPSPAPGTRPPSPTCGRGSPTRAGRSPSAWRWPAAPSWRSGPRASASAPRDA